MVLCFWLSVLQLGISVALTMSLPTPYLGSMSLLQFKLFTIFCVCSCLSIWLLIFPYWITCHWHHISSSVLDTLAFRLATEVDMYRSHVYANSTKCTYSSHRRSYLDFCSLLGYCPLPASETTILQYIAYLARRLKPQCIPQYLNIVSLLHKEHGLPNPMKDNWKISSTITGVHRLHGSSISRKLPITKDILFRLHSLHNMTSSFDATFWAICLTAFFGFFRKSHLLPTSVHNFNPRKQFIKSDFTFHSWGVAISVRWSKTLQFQERLVHIPLHTIPNSPLCPIAAILHFLHFIKCDSQYSSQSPMFTYLPPSSSQSIPIT